MKRILLPLLAAIALPTTAVNADIRSYCFNEWGEDYSMVEYCIKTQSSAGLNIYRAPDSNIKNNCLREWGEDYVMVELLYERTIGSSTKNWRGNS